MSITELTRIARKQSKTRNHSQRVALFKAIRKDKSYEVV